MRPLSLSRFFAFKILFPAILVCNVCTNAIHAQPKKKPAKKIVAKSAPMPRPVIKKMPGTRILLQTDSGNMVIRLYDSTPLHRDNFISKVNEGFYDSLLFHRVIRNFMIQGGDPNSKNAQPGEMLGMGSAPGERIPAEFLPSLFHKKGALAAARDQNPEKASSNCQFYIVQGKKYTPQELEMMSSQSGRQMPPEQKKAYETVGGVPFLDQNYTVFGEVEIGLDNVDRIAATQTANGDRPVTDMRMKMHVLSDEEFNVLWKDYLNRNRKPLPRKPSPKPIKKKTV